MLETIKELGQEWYAWIIGLGLSGVVSGLGIIWFRATPVIAAFRGTKDGLDGVERSILKQKEDNDKILDILELLAFDKVNSPVIKGEQNDRWVDAYESLRKRRVAEKKETVVDEVKSVGKSYLDRRL